MAANLPALKSAIMSHLVTPFQDAHTFHSSRIARCKRPLRAGCLQGRSAASAAASLYKNLRSPANTPPLWPAARANALALTDGKNCPQHYKIAQNSNIC